MDSVGDFFGCISVNFNSYFVGSGWHWVRWNIERSFDDHLCQKYSCQKLLKLDIVLQGTIDNVCHVFFQTWCILLVYAAASCKCRWYFAIIISLAELCKTCELGGIIQSGSVVDCWLKCLRNPTFLQKAQLNPVVFVGFYLVTFFLIKPRFFNSAQFDGLWVFCEL